MKNYLVGFSLGFMVAGLISFIGLYSFNGAWLLGILVPFYLVYKGKLLKVWFLIALLFNIFSLPFIFGDYMRIARL